MTEVKKDEADKPAIIEPLPWEKGGDAKRSPEDDLLDILDSEFEDEEDIEDETELDSDEDDPEDEDDDTDETDDDEDDDADGADEPDDDDEDDDAEEDEDDDDKDDEDDEDLTDNDLYEVKVQGETSQVTLEELKAGYSRTKDYTQKRQADAAEQATVMAEIGQRRDQYGSHLEQLKAVMESLTPAEPDWDAIRAENPGEYAAQKQDHADRLSAIAKVAAETEKVAAEKQTERDNAHADFLQSEMTKLVSSISEWQNDAVRETEIAELRAFATEAFGFTSEDLDNVVDHRLLLLLRENMKNRAKVKSGKKEIQKKRKTAKTMKPGSTSTRRKTRGKARKANEAARNKLAQSGSVQDAADTILGLLGDDD